MANTNHLSDPPEEIITPHPIAKWAEENKSHFAELSKKLNLDSKAFEYATWDFVDFAAGRTWKDEGSLERAREGGWVEEVDVWEGFVDVFERLKGFEVLPK